MEIAQLLFGMFLGYYVLSKRLRGKVNKGILWFFRCYHQDSLRRIKETGKTYDTIDMPVYEKPPPKFESSKTIKGVIISPEDYERLMKMNPDLRVGNK